MLPMPDGITQIGYVVRDLDRAIANWIQTYGAGPFFVSHFKVDGHEYRGQPAKVDVRVGVAYSSSLNIELLQPMLPGPSIYHEILDARGEGIHHFWRRCSDFDAEIARLTALGHPVVAGGPLPGIGKSYFVDTLETFGVFTEVQELSDAVYVALDEMHRAHLSWDCHTDPIRPFPAMQGP